MHLYFQDLEYNHLLYNTFGPITYSISENSIIKLQTNNGTGKTILLKTLIGLLIPKAGIMYNNNIINKEKTAFYYNNRLSNSQSKKYKLLTYIIHNKSNIWLFDEPYSFLDITSIIFYKKRIFTHINKGGIVILTDCIKKTMLPCIIYYTGLYWL
jgi:ABC-type transport system involved in cytochrome c biogenesis ATPase subunit